MRFLLFISFVRKPVAHAAYKWKAKTWTISKGTSADSSIRSKVKSSTWSINWMSPLRCHWRRLWNCGWRENIYRSVPGEYACKLSFDAYQIWDTHGGQGEVGRMLEASGWGTIGQTAPGDHIWQWWRRRGCRKCAVELISFCQLLDRHYHKDK